MLVSADEGVLSLLGGVYTKVDGLLMGGRPYYRKVSASSESGNASYLYYSSSHAPAGWRMGSSLTTVPSLMNNDSEACPNSATGWNVTNTRSPVDVSVATATPPFEAERFRFEPPGHHTTAPRPTFSGDVLTETSAIRDVIEMAAAVPMFSIYMKHGVVQNSKGNIIEWKRAIEYKSIFTKDPAITLAMESLVLGLSRAVLAIAWFEMSALGFGNPGLKEWASPILRAESVIRKSMEAIHTESLAKEPRHSHHFWDLVAAMEELALMEDPKLPLSTLSRF